MNVSHVTIPFDKLEEVLDLPENAKIVAAKEHDNGRFVVVRVIADTAPNNFVLEPGDPLTKIGQAYREVPPPIEPVITESEVVEGTQEPEAEDQPLL